MLKNMTARLCPSCGSYYHDPPALSRKNQNVEICPECGMKEALADASLEHLFGDTLKVYRAARTAAKGAIT
jgi:hydrogenase maturation factor HypF (carbamoyltransferase family)